MYIRFAFVCVNSSVNSSTKNVTTLDQSIPLIDTLNVEGLNNLELPEWAAVIYPDITHAILLRAYEVYTETEYMKTIKGGPFLTAVYQQMKRKMNGTLSQNMTIYSAHEITIFNVLRRLGAIDVDIPGFGAVLAFELHCPDGSECVVKVSKHTHTHTNINRRCRNDFAT